MTTTMDREHVERLYVPLWLSGLEFGDDGAQYMAMTALRSHGHTVIGDGYDDEFVWLWTPPGKRCACVIRPEIAPERILISVPL